MRCFLVFCVSVAGLLAQSAKPASDGYPLDIFLLIGQSNMAGRGEIDAVDREKIPGVLQFNQAGQWEISRDPVHFDRPDRTGTGLGRSFGFTLLKMGASARVGLVPAAFGGSALAEWTPGSNHYNNAVERTRAALAAAPAGSRLRGILWHQGEADTAQQELAATYADRFARMIAQLRSDLSAPDVPVIVGQLGEFLKDRPQNPHPFAGQVNQALATVPLYIQNAVFVSSAGLDHKGDILHFSSPALREFGRRYALAWMAASGGK